MNSTPTLIDRPSPIFDQIQQALMLPKVNAASDHELRMMITYIQTAIGIKSIPNDIEDLVMLNYIRHSLSKFTLDELMIAFTLLADSKLDLNIDHFQSFNTLYLGRVMESYSRFRFRYLTPAEQAEAPKQVTDQDMINLILLQYDHWLNKKEVTDFGGIQLRYLTKCGFIQMSLSQMDDILNQAGEVYKESHRDIIGRVLENGNDKDGIKDIARSISLRKWFKSIRDSNKDIKLILKAI